MHEALLIGIRTDPVYTLQEVSNDLVLLAHALIGGFDGAIGGVA